MIKQIKAKLRYIRSIICYLGYHSYEPDYTEGEWNLYLEEHRYPNNDNSVEPPEFCKYCGTLKY